MQRRNNIPLVSIIIPVFNEEKYLSKCLNSIDNQTYPKTETIIIDDGSTDSSLEIAKKYKTLSLETNHKGPGHARNFGVRMAKGEILVFVDADTYLDNDYIKYLVQPIINDNKVGTFSTAEYVANYNNIWAKCWNINMGINDNRRVVDSINDKGDVFRAIKRDFFIKSGGYLENHGYGEDKFISNIRATPVNKAICYHYNPESLRDVYFSARWIGRSQDFESFRNYLRYSLLNSIRRSIYLINKGAPKRFLMFKFVFDFGIISGVFINNKSRNRSK